MMRWGPAGSLLASVFLASLAPTPVSAQDPILDRVEQLAAIGRAEEAREVLLDWWADDRGEASRRARQRGYWLRGRLTVDPLQAELDFRRLSVEYPGGPFTDLALFRLAQSAFARGDAERANRFLSTLARDYRSSPVRAEAVAWFEAAGPSMSRVRASSAAEGGAESSGTPGSQAPPPSPPSPPVTDVVERRAPAQARRPATDPVQPGRYAVQLGAFGSEERARDLAARAVDAGLDTRLVRVRGSQLLHVRVGRFDSSGSASVFLRDVMDLGFTAAVVRDAHDEEPVRG